MIIVQYHTNVNTCFCISKSNNNGAGLVVSVLSITLALLGSMSNVADAVISGSLHCARCARLHVECRLNNCNCSVGRHPADAKEEYFWREPKEPIKLFSLGAKLPMQEVHSHFFLDLLPLIFGHLAVWLYAFHFLDL